MKKLMFIMASVLMVLASCSREEVMKQTPTPTQEGDFSVTVETKVGGTVTRSGIGGTISGTGRYAGDADFTLAAKADPGYRLVTFNGGKVQEGEAPLTKGYYSASFSHNIDKSDWHFTVEFSREYTISASAGEGGSVSGGGKFLKDESVTLTATPNDGYTFDGWYENGTKVSSSASYTFTVSSDRTITAKFRQKSRERKLYYKFFNKPILYSGGVTYITTLTNEDVDIVYEVVYYDSNIDENTTVIGPHHGLTIKKIGRDEKFHYRKFIPANGGEKETDIQSISVYVNGKLATTKNGPNADFDFDFTFEGVHYKS